jgi:4-amino-4-deoxy-L-arabinose transferase-like glycosyltransferase
VVYTQRLIGPPPTWRVRSLHLDRLLILALLVAVAGLHMATAGVPDVYDELPGQYAGTAREMVESGNWLIPTLGGVPRLQKPPLVYWLTAASLSLFRRGEFGVRLPTALALVGLMGVTLALGRRLYAGNRGVIAAVILGTSFGLVALGKLIMPEPFLAFGIALALLAAVRAVEDKPRRRWWAPACWCAGSSARRRSSRSGRAGWGATGSCRRTRWPAAGARVSQSG